MVGGAAWWLGLLSWLLPFLWSTVWGQQDLKKKYTAQWALVTGGSSGIGLAVAKRLAKQGLNLLIVAVPNKALDDTPAAIAEVNPDVDVRVVGANLGAPVEEWLPSVQAAMDGALPQVAFLNAGYIVTGFFDSTPLAAQLANARCNAIAAMALAHDIVARLQKAKARGCIVFTSSPAGFMPAPFSAMYAATKSFLTAFATSLAPEVAAEGIDVSVVHPSPVASRFYEGAHDIDILKMFKATGVSPDVLAKCMIAGAGRAVVIDQGYYTVATRVLLKIIDVTALASIITAMAPTLPDFVKMRAESNAKAAKKQ